MEEIVLPPYWWRIKDVEFDSFWRDVSSYMMISNMVSLNKSMRYAYRKSFVCWMRKEGFKFYPVLKDESQERSSKVDYHFSLSVDNRHVKLEITIN